MTDITMNTPMQTSLSPEGAANEPIVTLAEMAGSEAVASEASLDGKPAGLPEKFWDAENKTVRMQALLNSYLALEKRMSNSVDMPKDEESKMALMKRLGMPDKPCGYKVDVSHGMFSMDMDVNERLHKCGCTPEQVQEVYNLAADKMVPMVMEIAQEYYAEREVEKLMEEFGGAEKWKEMSRQLLAYGQKNMPSNVLDNMASSYEGVMALYKMMKGGEPSLNTDQSASPSFSSEGQDDLNSMMKDPKYWRDRDPSYVRAVTEGFKRMYDKS